MRRCLTAAVALALALGWTLTAQAQGFGKALKGTVVFGGKDAPKPEVLNVNKDPDVCLANGPLKSQDWKVNAKNLGIQDVFIWLETDPAGGDMPVHPDLKGKKKKEVVLDQPNCQFHPNCFAIEEGTFILVKTPAPINHNFRWTGNPMINPGGNVNMVPNSSFQIKDLKADTFPVITKCDIHPWMSGYMRVFDHPYFALTDEDGKFELPNPPAGKYRLKVWHPASGWVGLNGKQGTKAGIPITIDPNGVTDAPKLVINKK